MNKKYHYVLAFLLAVVSLVQLGCGSSRLDLLPDDGVILAFGDSLTVGVGASQQNSYPAVLADLTGLKVVNSGVSGETSDLGLKRLPEELERVDPDMLILIEGGNDILRNRSQSVLKKNLEEMINVAEGRGVPVVLIGVPVKSVFSSSAPLYEELAEQYQLVFDDSLIAGLQRSPSLKSDHVHFNEKGYRKMAESIYSLLKDNGALK